MDVFFENNDDAKTNYPLFNTNCRVLFFPPHFHKELEIYYITKGQVDLYINSGQADNFSISMLLPYPLKVFLFFHLSKCIITKAF